MDHLEDRCGRDGVAHARIRRGQLVLVAGFALAVTFVALALLLNSAIFAENLATRQTGGDATEAEQISGSVDEAVKTQLHSVNQRNTGYNYVSLRKDLDEVVANWTTTSNLQLATDGTALQVSVNETTNGTRILHLDETVGWDNRHGADDWTVFENTDPDDVRWYQLNISREALLTATLDNVLTGLTNNAFYISVEEASGQTYDVYVFRGNLMDNNVYVMAGDNVDFDITDPFLNDVSQSCTVSQDRVKIDLWEGRVNGFECPQLSFIHNLTGDVDVTYHNADELLTSQTGTYDVSLNATAGIDDSEFYKGRGSDSPFLRSQVTHVQVEREIQRPDGVYDETTTVKPPPRTGFQATDEPVPAVSVSEPDAGFGGLAPLLGNLVSTEFTVNWRVKDANGDLESVDVSVSPDPDNQSPWSHSISGTSAAGSEQFVCSGGLLSTCSETYTITVTATDAAGHSRTITREFEYTSGLLGIL